MTVVARQYPLFVDIQLLPLNNKPDIPTIYITLSALQTDEHMDVSNKGTRPWNSERLIVELRIYHLYKAVDGNHYSLSFSYFVGDMLRCASIYAIPLLLPCDLK